MGRSRYKITQAEGVHFVTFPRSHALRGNAKGDTQGC